MNDGRQTWSDGAVLVREVVLRNEYGLHARPAAMIVAIASRFDADVTIEKAGHRVSGKSMLGLMTLEAPCGARLRFTAEGPAAEQALDELEQLIKRNFNE